jgi:hypothetical protein
LALGEPFVALRAIVAREVDVIPAERGDGRDEGIVDLLVPAQSGDRAFEIDGVPEHDRSGDQIEAAGPVALIFKRSIPDLAEAVNDPEKSPKAADRVLANSCVAPNTSWAGKGVTAADGAHLADFYAAGLCISSKSSLRA